MRYLLTLIALLLAAPALAEAMPTSCDALPRLLAGAQGGETFVLTGECGKLAIARTFPRRVTIDASKAVVSGLSITGGNVSVVGGVFTAKDGLNGFAYDGYAIDIRGAHDVRIADAQLADAKYGIVLTGGRNVVIENNRFLRLRADGIQARQTANVRIERNIFSDFRSIPARCKGKNGTVTLAGAKRHCTGTWTDGDHSDAVQIYDGMDNVWVRWNRIEGVQQGIGQFGGSTSRPLSRVVIAGNLVRAFGGNQVTLYNCRDCRIEGNTVRRGVPLHGRQFKAVIVPGTASRCGNDVEDGKPDRAC